MSFAITTIGLPDAIKRKLAKESERLTGQSKAEFDAIRPALETILDQQVGNGLIHLSANGHATITTRKESQSLSGIQPGEETVKTYGHCEVSIKPLGVVLAE